MKERPSNSKRTVRWPLLIILVVVLVAGAGGGFYYFKLRPAAKQATSSVTTTAGPSPSTTVTATATLSNTTGITSTNGLTVTVASASQGRLISQYIYGIANGDASYMNRLGVKLDRWGGNPASRYNWEIGNAWNAARDFGFANTDYDNTRDSDKLPGGAADNFVLGNQQGGAASLITIPALGYVARDTNRQTSSKDVPTDGGPATGDSGAIQGYDPAANRVATSLPISPTKAGPLKYPPDLTDGVVYADEWVKHLVTRFGPAETGGVRFYTVDNEPDLWAETHTDVHPALPTYDELLQKYLAVAGAIRAQDKSAKLTGPAFSSIMKADNSPLDRATNNQDRLAHKDQPLLEWWLDGVQAADRENSRRSLDVLDLHYYPGQTLYKDPGTDATLRTKRIEATRALWDSTFMDESTGQNTNLLPRMHDLVDKHYPGTGIGIGEWNFGGEKDISGALAVADTLGIFGEQEVYYASYWTFPPEGSPAYFGFKMFTNYDSEGHRFGNLYLPTTTGDRSKVAIYAARQSDSNGLTVMLINKTGDEQSVNLDLGALKSQPVKVWQYSPTDLSQIRQLPDLSYPGNPTAYKLEAYSITLLRVDNAYGA